jgi:hypothetical protein
MEKFYTSQAGNPALAQMVLEGCIEKARDMDLPLMASLPYLKTDPRYPDPIQSLGGPVPFEYVDATRGINPGGGFEIHESYILFAPHSL